MDADQLVRKYDESTNDYDCYVAALDLVSWLGDSESVYYDNAWQDAGSWLRNAFAHTTTDEDAFDVACRLAEWCAEHDTSYYFDNAWQDSGAWWCYAYRYATSDGDARVAARRLAAWCDLTGNTYYYDNYWRDADYWRSLS